MRAPLRSRVHVRGGGFGGGERSREPLLLAVITRAVPEAGTADAGRAVTADDDAFGVFADHVVDEQILGEDHVAFHAYFLGDVRDTARAVALVRRLDDDVV